MDNGLERRHSIPLCAPPLLCIIGAVLDDDVVWQVVGVCEEELKVSQRWNGPGILNLIKTIPVYDSLLHASDNNCNDELERRMYENRNVNKM